MGVELSERAWSGIHAWLRARSLFFDDPEGNTIELIAHDPSAAEGIPPGYVKAPVRRP
jgi:catechol-2,3-dioxygenase